MKKIVSLILALVMVLSLSGFSYAASYTDLTKGNTKYASAVDVLTELKVIAGFPDNTFRPEDRLTRAQLAKMLDVCMGVGEQAESLKGKTIFSDVDASHWASGYINAAVQSNLVAGYPDGTFQPEKEVTYAEAFTMCLRALGYGKVVEAEGTWPTAYMLKATELGLTTDMEEVSTYVPATRGNTAILLWNMLRTNMWRIASESEKNGMTKTNTGDCMLNVKFPNYTYVEDGYITDITVTDYENVTLTIDKEITAKITNVDLTQLIEGEQVSALIKKDKKENTFLTLTPTNLIICGFAEDKTDNKLKINGVEYKLDDIDFEVTEKDYLVVEVDNKKIVSIKTLPTEGTYVETLSRMKSTIKEDELIIKNGKWTTRDAIKVGDVYTKVEDYYVVSSDIIDGEFNILFTDTVKWNKIKVDLDYLSIANKDYRLGNTTLVAREGKDNKTSVSLAKLRVKIKDNDYSGKDAIVYMNYLGIPVRIEFGEINNVSDENFYAVVSNGAWVKGSSKGKVYNIDVVDSQGVEYTLETIANLELPEILTSNEDYYVNNPDGKGIFIWAELDENDKIEEIVILEAGAECTDKYIIAAVDAESEIDGRKISISGEVYSMTNATIIFESKAHKDDDDKIDGFNVYVSDDYTEYDNIIIPEGTLAAIDSKNKVKYLFITNKAESNELFYGVAEKNSNYSKENIVINGEKYEITKDSISYNVGDLVQYSLVDGKVKVKNIFDMELLDDSIMLIVDEIDEDYEVIVVSGDDNISLDKEDVDYKNHKDFKVYNVNYKVDDENYIEIENLELNSTLGYDGLEVEQYDRILILEEEKVILVFSGLDEDEHIYNGMIITDIE